MREFAIDARFTTLSAASAMKSAALAAVEDTSAAWKVSTGWSPPLFARLLAQENGLVVTRGDVGSIGLVKSPGNFAQGCEAQLKLGLYRPLDRLRGHRVLAVDEERGLVVATAIADFNLAQRKYTLNDGREVEAEAVHAMARELFEVYKIVDGRIVAIEAVSVDQPYGMPSAWQR